MENCAKQSEILFLWDGENWNPNGDMLNNNAPRYDEISNVALVSDVRLKRTIRDDLYERKGLEIFVRETRFEDGNIMDGKGRVEELTKDSDDKIEALKVKCIDVRAFGGVFPVEKKQYNLTGALQFKMSKSIHRVDAPVYIKGTGAFASGPGKENKTFREEYILPYAMFATYGIISGLSAKKSGLSNDDLSKILDSLWVGTKHLVTRTKIGQMPRFLLKITYENDGDFIGDLNNRICVKDLKTASEQEIRSVKDFKVDISSIVKLTENFKDNIEKIEYKIDDSIVIDSIPDDWQRMV